MKKCAHCGVKQDLALFATPRTRVCNDCKKIVSRPKSIPPEQKLTDAEMVTLWEKSNKVTVIRSADEVFEPVTVLELASQPFQYDSYGNRIYQHLNKPFHSSMGSDESSYDYGIGGVSSGGD